jgi:MFS family permease
MLKDPSFAVFVFVSFIIAIVLAGYFVFTAPFLEYAGTQLNVEYMRLHAAPLMTLGQCSEIIFMLTLPFFLKRLGMKWTLAIGMAAWGLRYGVFAIGGPAVLIILAILLHGICYDFFFVAAYIHTNSKATDETRASAQAMFNFVVMGVGMFFGSIAFGWLFDYYTTDAGTDWTRMWLWPALGAGLALVLFLAAFRPRNKANQTDETATS